MIMITDRMGLHSVLLPFVIVIYLNLSRALAQDKRILEYCGSDKYAIWNWDKMQENQSVDFRQVVRAAGGLEQVGNPPFYFLYSFSVCFAVIDHYSPSFAAIRRHVKFPCCQLGSLGKIAVLTSLASCVSSPGLLTSYVVKAIACPTPWLSAPSPPPSPICSLRDWSPKM